MVILLVGKHTAQSTAIADFCCCREENVSNYYEKLLETISTTEKLENVAREQNILLALQKIYSLFSSYFRVTRAWTKKQCLFLLLTFVQQICQNPKNNRVEKYEPKY